MLGYEEKLERIELIDAASDAGRLARGLDQLLESLAHGPPVRGLTTQALTPAWLATKRFPDNNARCGDRPG